MQIPKILFAALLLFSVVEAAASGADADAKRRPPGHYCGLGRKVIDASLGGYIVLLKTQIEDEYLLLNLNGHPELLVFLQISPSRTKLALEGWESGINPNYSLWGEHRQQIGP
ncbi:hypothetical protein C8J56DRAFT_885773 [Mycena floridula]|nr:hypothetical protein C8J56DRAFT_885773 [Mycena floridula]